MAKNTRKTKLSSTLETVGGITVGLGVGAVGVPKIMEMVDPEGKFNPTLVNGVGAAGAAYLSTKQKGLVQSALQGLAAGLAWNALAPIVGMGYVDDNSTSFLNRVAGAGDDYFPSRQNPGAV